jgi:hypothetical protein
VISTRRTPPVRRQYAKRAACFAAITNWEDDTVMKRLLAYLSRGLAFSGVGVFFFRNYLFSKYAKLGTLNPDSIHTELVNNHGDYSYISVAQSDHVYVLTIASVSLFILAFVIDVVQKVIEKRGRVRLTDKQQEWTNQE